MPRKFKVGSLFAGIGGICSGFKQAGCDVVWANEYNKNACLTYKENFPKTKLFKKDVNDFLDVDYPQLAFELDESERSIKKLNLEKVDIITSGFPCQAFSVAGYRQGFEDKKGRGNHFFSTAKAIELMQPRAFLLENVKNLAGHDKGNTIKIIQETIFKLGYSYIQFCLNAKDYGDLPQNRERIYIVGFRGEADYKNNDSNKADSILTHQFKIPEKIILKKKIHDLLFEDKQDDKFYYTRDHQYYDELDSTMTSKDTIYQWRRVYVRENKSKVCPTLTANMGTGGHNVPLIRDAYGIRKLTPEECLRFQGFPEEFKFPSDMSQSHKYKQAGNSVAVPVVKRIANEIVRLLSNK
jgi:DNA (cytosine-5)-methyltransferase 1